jgi:GTP cyclohydrolase I
MSDQTTDAPFWTYADVAPTTPTTLPKGRDVDVAQALVGIEALLRLMGEDPTRPGLVGTPARVVRAYLEMASRPGDPGHDLAVVFADIDHPNTPVVVGPIPFVSLCEHHLLPFTGEAWVSYVPSLGRVVGLSKLPRTVHHFAARPQVQERLTQQIADALSDHLDPSGVGVVIRGDHTCMSLRGARTLGARMETTDLRGSLSTNPFRSQFLDATKGGHRG